MRSLRHTRISMALACAALLFGSALGLSAADKVEVKFWDPDTRDTWVNARNLVMKDYQAKNPNVEFSFTTTDWNQLMPKLMASVASGSTPTSAVSTRLPWRTVPPPKG